MARVHRLHSSSAVRRRVTSNGVTPVPDLVVVVLNWNNAEDTLACLASIKAGGDRAHVVVVDNGSTDGSADLIEASELADTMLRTRANLGYAGGNDVGLEAALALGSRYVVVLNNDTIVAPGTLRRLVAHLEGQPGHVALSPVITYDDRPTEIWFAGGVLDRDGPRHLQPAELIAGDKSVRETALLTGCCIAATRETWLLVGDFDRRFFLTFEDSDWSLRATGHGVWLLVAGDCEVRHKVSRSFRGTAMGRLGTFYYFRNGLLFRWRWARSSLPGFIWTRLVRPTASRLLRRAPRYPVAWSWLGLAAALTGRFGRAPAWLETRAAR